MDTATALQFLNELRQNNNRDWFMANKRRYQRIRDEFLSFLGEWIRILGETDSSVAGVNPGDCLFRINRDVRFSNDKSPYKINIGAFVSRTGRKGHQPGYYLHLEPGQSFIAGGLYMPPPDVLKAVREQIYFHPEKFLNIIQSKEFTRYFSTLDDFDKMIKPPRGFDPGWPYIDLLKYRSYIVGYPLPDEKVTAADFGWFVAEVSLAIFPFNSFLYEALRQME